MHELLTNTNSLLHWNNHNDYLNINIYHIYHVNVDILLQGFSLSNLLAPFFYFNLPARLRPALFLCGIVNIFILTFRQAIWSQFVFKNNLTMLR